MKKKHKNRRKMTARRTAHLYRRYVRPAVPVRLPDVPEQADMLPIEVYDSELAYMFKDMAKHPDIETGWFGFGNVTEDGTPRLLLVDGPGPKANHQPAFFQQDIDYMKEAWKKVSPLGMHHILIGHSHHKMHLPRPSGKDVDSMFTSLDELNLEYLILVIGTIEGTSMCLYPYLFKNDHTYCRMEWRRIAGTSPVRKMMEKWETK